MQQANLQIRAAIRIALPTWSSLNGQLHLWPINKLQFCWKTQNHSIEDQRTEINQIYYKLSTLSSNQRTQQAQKHPSSVKRSIETIETQRKLRFI